MKLPTAGLFSSSNYEPLSNDSEENFVDEKSLKVQRPYKAIAVLFICLAAALMGYVAGRHGGNASQLDWLGQKRSFSLRKIGNDDLMRIPAAPAGSITHTFKYRRVFAEAPTNDTEKTWEIMFPKGRGFIQNPAISPDIVGVSVFHQLHCLDGLRRGYYAALNGSQSTKHLDEAHMRHCIDYLRQSLLCCADTNMEPVDPDLGGVTGWQHPRQCRDIVRIKQWTEDWRVHNQTNIQ